MRTLLLADDSITVQRVIALTFAGEPIQVVSVGDGQQAIEKMAAKPPDIVLAGTTLPTVNGYDLAKFMRTKNELRSVPVLLLAGAFEDVDTERLTASGANGFIEKPVEPTNVIGRVKALLGLKSDEKPAAPAGRANTPAGTGGKPEDKPPIVTTPRVVTNVHGKPTKWEQLRSQTGLEPNTKSVEDASTRSSDYLDTLDTAFDSLDQQLSGRAATTTSRNPSGPLAQSSGPADPRSPGRAPSGEPDATGNPIFEIDDEWFGSSESQARADAKAGRREIAEDLQDPALQLPGVTPPLTPIFEVDDEWFKEGEQARAAKLEAQRELAAEMGIHDVDFPEPDPAVTAPASDLDFDFGFDDLKKPDDPAKAAAAPVAPPPAPAAPLAPSRDVADDFTALLAFEQGDKNALPAAAPAPPPEIRVVAPEITAEMLDQIASRVARPQISDAMLEGIASRVAPPQITDAMLDQIASRVAPPQVTSAMLDQIASRVAPPVVTDAMLGQIAAGVAPPQINEQMLDQIAARVADRLNSSTFGEQLREQISAALRDTVRSVVSETSERLVRDEIDRIKNKG